MTSNPSASLKLKKTKITDTNITLSHGSGGKAMRDLINEIFVNNFDNNLLATLEESMEPLMIWLSVGQFLSISVVVLSSKKVYLSTP